MELIKITRDGKDITVSKSDYIKAKFLDLVESFPSLTIDNVEGLVNEILNNKPSSGGMIRAYIMDDNPRPVAEAGTAGLVSK